MTERELALEILLEIHQKNVLSHNAIADGLAKADDLKADIRKPFVNYLVSGVTKNYLLLEYLIVNQAKRPIGKIKPVVRMLLAMGIYQGFYMDVPPSAACNETVKLARKRHLDGLTGFINGVLRGIFREFDNKEALEAKIDEMLSGESNIKKLSVKYSAPEWLCDYLVREYGNEATKQMLSDALSNKNIIIYRMASVASEEELLASLLADGAKAIKTDYEYAYKLECDGKIDNLSAFKKGMFIVQDIASIMAGEALPEIGGEEKINILDVCAAPGGKSLHAADFYARSLGLKLSDESLKDKIFIESRDVSAKKLIKIAESAARVGIDFLDAKCFDALELDEASLEKFDVVIADLPCSGLGVIGKKADLKYKTTYDDILSLAKLQEDIIKVIVRYVKPGGYILYSTCTIAREENENHEKLFSELNFKKAGNEKLLLPSASNDGFYFCLYKKQ